MTDERYEEIMKEVQALRREAAELRYHFERGDILVDARRVIFDDGAALPERISELYNDLQQKIEQLSATAETTT